MHMGVSFDIRSIGLIIIEERQNQSRGAKWTFGQKLKGELVPFGSSSNQS